MFGEDQCVESLSAAVFTGKALLIVPHHPACFFGLRLSNRRAVSVYRSRYADFPEPAVNKGRCELWLRADIETWLRGRTR